MAEWKKIITSGSHAELAGVTGSKGFHGSGTDLTFSDTAMVTGDALVFVDADGGTKKDNISDVVTLLAGDGIQNSSNKFAIDVDVMAGVGLTADNTNEELDVSSAQTGIQTIYNTGLIIGRAEDDTTINFTADDTIVLDAGSTAALTATTAGISVTTTGSISRVESTQISSSNVLSTTLTATSASINTIGAFTLGGKLTAGTIEIEGSNFDINGGTIDGITSLTAGGNLDIGTHDFRARNLTADALAAGKVLFTGTAGLLSVDSNFSFASDTLTAKSGSFDAISSENISGSLRGDADINVLNVVGTGSAGYLTAVEISGSFRGDGSNLSGVGFQIDELSNTLTAVAQDDLLVVADVDDSNEEKKITFSNFEDQIFSNINAASSDIAIVAGGAITLANNSVGNDEMADDAIGNAELKQNEDITLQALTTTNNLSVGGNAIITGDLTVNGETTVVSSSNLEVRDRFILLNSGSNAGDGGIIVQHGSTGSGSAFAYDVSVNRWGFPKSGSTGKTEHTVSPEAYVSAVVTDDNEAEFRKNGNIRVQSGEIFIFVE
tara:strand:+ start:591 stop:2243 length:1653 start_codon:yes stop_codon:yes gene_type:complete